jgi:membrane protein
MDRGGRPIEVSRGHDASTPSQIPARGWLDIFKRLFWSFNDDRIMLIAGGVTFYLLLALFPALAAFVSTYGFFADPATVTQHIALLDDLVPVDGLQIIHDHLDSLTSQDPGALGFGILLGLLVAFWSANNGVKAIFEALNIAYGEKEKRSFLWLNMVALAFTLGAMLTAVLMIAALGILPVVLNLMRLESMAEILLSLARWPLLVLVLGTGVMLLYRYGPSREPAKWRWLTWGATFSTLTWMAASAGFSYYLQNFAQYNVTYGSLGAIIGFMMWTWISVIILVLGAELNAAMEHQTAVDSTTGRPLPMGERGAFVADTVADGDGPSTAEAADIGAGR